MRKKLRKVLKTINPYRKLMISILLVGLFISTIYAFKTEEIQAKDDTKTNPRVSSVRWQKTSEDEKETDKQGKEESGEKEKAKEDNQNQSQKTKETKTVTKTVKVEKQVQQEPIRKEGTNNSKADQQTVEKLQIIVRNGPKAGSYQVEFKEDKNAFELMEQAQADYGLTFSYSSSQYGIFIESIGGLTNSYSDSKYWMLYYNGKLSNKGVASIYPENGDQITWQYELVSW